MFVSYLSSDAYGDSISPDSNFIMNASSKSDAWRQILQNGKDLEYYLFDTTDIKLKKSDKHVTFKIKDSYFSDTNDVFDKFCMSKFGKIHRKWTYAEFSLHLDELKEFLVENQVSDDPFPSYLWHVEPINIRPDDKYVTVCNVWGDGSDIFKFSATLDDESVFVKTNEISYCTQSHKIDNFTVLGDVSNGYTKLSKL